MSVLVIKFLMFFKMTDFTSSVHFLSRQQRFPSAADAEETAHARREAEVVKRTVKRHPEVSTAHAALKRVRVSAAWHGPTGLPVLLPRNSSCGKPEGRVTRVLYLICVCSLSCFQQNSSKKSLSLDKIENRNSRI